MINPLICHSGALCPAVQSLSVEVLVLPSKGLRLRYYLKADLQHIVIPALQTASMVDGLWEHTCFEAFIAIDDGKSYQEFNFSPSGKWAAYRFDDYRVRREWQSNHAYAINVECTNDGLILTVEIPREDLPMMPIGKIIYMGLTAVIEATDGSRSYWALFHPADAPDFHHRAGFVYLLEPHSF